jgi:hypothetical protein
MLFPPYTGSAKVKETVKISSWKVDEEGTPVNSFNI